MNIALPVLGGLALFLYGMNVMGTGLQKIAGSKLKRIIEVLTNNRLMGVVIGTVVTMIIQSSSATTVMVIGFVNAGLMTLTQAVGVIMGANLGTTFTAQLIAFKVTDYAPIALALGVGIWIITSKERTKTISEILIGFGILFIGMDMMGNGLAPLSEMSWFAASITKLNNPYLGILVGIGLTTIVQSSSAAIGLIQALAGQGLLPINLAFPILFGDNIGTTTTALISSVGANKTAKRAALIHFLFNLMGTIIFMTVLRIPIQSLVLRLSPNDIPRQIANAHTLFNLINIVIQLPFARLLVILAESIIPGEIEKDTTVVPALDPRLLETPSIALGQVSNQVLKMGQIVEENLVRVRRAFVDEIYDDLEEVFKSEALVNEFQKNITEYLVKLSNTPLSQKQHNEVNALFYTINDIERVGDHIDNIGEATQYKLDNDLRFTGQAKDELYEIFDKCQEIFSVAIMAFKTGDKEMAKRVDVLEEEIDRIEALNRKSHMDRLSKGQCETEAGILFLDCISNLERIADHSLNISMYVLDKFK